MAKNKGADQLNGYCAADLCLCFCISKKQVSHDVALIISLRLKNKVDLIYKVHVSTFIIKYMKHMQ